LKNSGVFVSWNVKSGAQSQIWSKVDLNVLQCTELMPRVSYSRSSINASLVIVMSVVMYYVQNKMIDE